MPTTLKTEGRYTPIPVRRRILDNGVIGQLNNEWDDRLGHLPPPIDLSHRDVDVHTLDELEAAMPKLDPGRCDQVLRRLVHFCTRAIKSAGTSCEVTAADMSVSIQALYRSPRNGRLNAPSCVIGHFDRCRRCSGIRRIPRYQRHRVAQGGVAATRKIVQ